MSLGEEAFLAEAQKSANALPTAESNRIYQAQLANEALAAAEVEHAAADVEFGDIVVTARLRDAVYRPGIDLPLLSQISGGRSARNSRLRIGGNGGPPLEDWQTLRQIGVPQVNGPTGALFGVLDNLFDLTGPALEMQSEFLDLWTKNNIREILMIDPGHKFPSRLVPGDSERESIRWKTVNYNFYESELAATKYIYQGDIGALQNETLRVYQGFVDQGFVKALSEARDGILFQPKSWSRPQALGTRMDQFARESMNAWFAEHRINPGADINVTVNSRLAGGAEGSYTIPDVRVGGVVFDASIARKDSKRQPKTVDKRRSASALHLGYQPRFTSAEVHQRKSRTFWPSRRMPSRAFASGSIVSTVDIRFNHLRT